MRLFALVVLLATLPACSGSSSGEAPLAPTPRSGVGRLPDVPEVACPETRGSTPLGPETTFSECHADADCTEGRNGRCVRLSNHGPHGPALEATTCSYDACFRDADCGSPRAACHCSERAPTEAGTGHFCAGGECSADADCGAGRYCRRGRAGRRCHSPADLCTEETECGEGLTCTLRHDGLYDCLPYTSPLG